MNDYSANLFTEMDISEKNIQIYVLLSNKNAGTE